MFSQDCHPTVGNFDISPLKLLQIAKYRGVGRGGGSEGSDDPPFLGANFIHFYIKC